MLMKLYNKYKENLQIKTKLSGKVTVQNIVIKVFAGGVVLWNTPQMFQNVLSGLKLCGVSRNKRGESSEAFAE